MASSLEILLTPWAIKHAILISRHRGIYATVTTICLSVCLTARFFVCRLGCVADAWRLRSGRHHGCDRCVLSVNHPVKFGSGRLGCVTAVTKGVTYVSSA